MQKNNKKNSTQGYYIENDEKYNRYNYRNQVEILTTLLQHRIQRRRKKMLTKHWAIAIRFVGMSVCRCKWVRVFYTFGIHASCPTKQRLVLSLYADLCKIEPKWKRRMKIEFYSFVLSMCHPLAVWYPLKNYSTEWIFHNANER